MYQTLILFLLPIAVFSGWIFGYRYKKAVDKKTELIPHNYFLGLNYLINEQPDKAVDVFIKMLEVNLDTVETHLALGSLFRRRGEVDRAIRLHQNLIARPQLERKQRVGALFELAQDYLRAGVLDRAERLFLELIKIEGEEFNSLNNLINIYQQQKDWHQAINMAKRLEKLNKTSMENAIAHYYCELATQCLHNKSRKKAHDYLDKALSCDPDCARVNIVLGKLYIEEKEYKKAILAFHSVYEKDKAYMSEIINDLFNCYKELKIEDEYVDYLEKKITKTQCIYFVFAMTDYLAVTKGNMAAIKYLSKQIHNYGSVAVLKRILDLCASLEDLTVVSQIFINHLNFFKNIVDNYMENKSLYHCVQCGFAGRQLYWQCPGCKRWNSIKPC